MGAAANTITRLGNWIQPWPKYMYTCPLTCLFTLYVCVGGETVVREHACSVNLSLPPVAPSPSSSSLCAQIEDIALVYHRPDDGEQKYLDLDGDMEELTADYNLVCDRLTHAHAHAHTHTYTHTYTHKP